MRKIIFLITVFFCSYFLFSLQIAYADDSDCSPGFTNPETNQQSYTDPSPLREDNLKQIDKFYSSFNVKIKVKNQNKFYKIDDRYRQRFYEWFAWSLVVDNKYQEPNSDGIVTFDIKVQDINEDENGVQNFLFYSSGPFKLGLLTPEQTGDLTYCTIPLNTILAPTPTSWPTSTPAPPRCTIEIFPNDRIIQPLQKVGIRVLANDKNDLERLQRTYTQFKVVIAKEKEGKEERADFDLTKNPDDIRTEYYLDYTAPTPFPTGRYYIEQNIGGFPNGYKVTASVFVSTGTFIDWDPFASFVNWLFKYDPSQFPCGQATFEVGKVPSIQTPTLPPDEKKKAENLKNLEQICEENILRPEDKDYMKKDYTASDVERVANKDQKKRLTENLNCKNCVTGKGEEGSGAWTAIGCLPTNIPKFFEKYVFTIGLGLAGGIGFLLIVWGAFTILISGGNPEQINHGREIIVSAIAGLLLIIFSVLILKIIGVDIFKIPGFQ